MFKNIIVWVVFPYIKVAKLLYWKWEGKHNKVTRMAGSAGVVVIGFFVWMALIVNIFGGGSGTTAVAQNAQTQSATVQKETLKVTPKPTISPEEQAKLDYQKWIEKQFSAWDGSHMGLVKLVKENMNDPKSFEHVETKFSDNGSGLTILMKFRGNNAFGGKVLNTVKGAADYKTNTIKIIE